jgi:hypothetical protein
MGIGLANGFHGRLQAPTSGTQRIDEQHRSTQASEVVLDYIAIYLGPATARAAMTACCRAIGRAPETVQLQDVPRLLAALRPMLGTLLGGSSCQILLRRIERDLSL